MDVKASRKLPISFVAVMVFSATSACGKCVGNGPSSVTQTKKKRSRMRKSSEGRNEGGRGNAWRFSRSELCCQSLGRGVTGGGGGRNFHFLLAITESGVGTRGGEGYDLTPVFKRLPASSGERRPQEARVEAGGGLERYPSYIRGRWPTAVMVLEEMRGDGS